jgi:Toxin SymE, type I toxin-antitoxin system
MKEYKRIKIATKYVDDNDVIGKINTIPKISFEGNWLQDAGFDPGNTVSMKIEVGRITILSI